MLDLKHFEGTSSNDAPAFGGRDTHDYWIWGLWAIIHDVLIDIWYGVRSLFRKRKVYKLRAEILPQFPNSQICPQCLGVVRRT